MYFSVSGQFTTIIKWSKLPIDKHDLMFKILPKTAVKHNAPKTQIHCSCNWCGHHLQRLLLPLSSVEDRLLSESSLDWDFQKKNLYRWWTPLSFFEMVFAFETCRLNHLLNFSSYYWHSDRKPYNLVMNWLETHQVYLHPHQWILKSDLDPQQRLHWVTRQSRI